MIKLLANWLKRGRDQQEMLSRALQHFEAATGKWAIPDMSRVLLENDRGFIVRVCYYSGSIPPSRVWYSFPTSADESIEELSFEEVRQLGEGPWR
jgi:hypothetical protein